MGDPGYLFRIIKYSYSNKFNIFEAKYFQTKKQCVVSLITHTHTHSKGCIGGFLPYGYFDNINSANNTN